MKIALDHEFKLDCSSCPIRDRAFCSRCDDTEISAVSSIKFHKSVPAGTVFAISGDTLDLVASVISGVATLSKIAEDGRTQTVSLLLPSDFIGLPGHDVYSHHVTAITDLSLCCIRRKSFDDLMMKTPHLQVRMIEILSQELDAAREWMFLLGRMTARERIAGFLIMLIRRSEIADQCTHDGKFELELPLSREEIASYLGLTFETVSRQLSILRSQKIIKFSSARNVCVSDFGKLANVASGRFETN